MTTLADIRRKARLALILRATGPWNRHPHPGQRYVHGWKRTAFGVTVDRVKAMPDKDLIEAWNDAEANPTESVFPDEVLQAMAREIGRRAGDGDTYKAWLTTERKVLANQRRRLAARSRRERERNSRIDELIGQGLSPEEAWERVTGGSVAKEHAWDLVGRRDGESYEKALRRGYSEAVERQIADAEDVVVGYWLSPEGKRGVARAEAEAKKRKRFYRFDPSDLWSMPEAQYEAWASDEAKDYLRSLGGRMTFAAWRAQVER